MRKIITTTGISLLTNAERELKKRRQEITDRDLQLFWQQVGASAASAETNSLLKIAHPDEEIVLLYTNTTEGKKCANEIKRYLESQDWSKVKSRQLPLEKNESQFERHGLRELVNILVEEIGCGQKEGKEVIINATGGFKAEIAYTTMVGMIFQVPVKYIYQDFQNPITFPSLPVSWNIDLLLEYEDFFAWIDDEPRNETEVEQRLKSIDAATHDRVYQLLLPADPEGYIFLSPAGTILWQRVKQQRELGETLPEPPDSGVAPKDKISSSIKHSKHGFYKDPNFRHFIEKISELPAVVEIIGGHEESGNRQRIKSVSDDGSIRLLWANDSHSTNITIRTTARGQSQTLAFCDRYIRPLLN